jgi:GNAT superfamily N-acetyltransferase
VTDPRGISVRLATTHDIPAMQAIEIAAGRLFAGIGMQDVADDGAHETEVLEGHVHGDRAWVAESGGVVCAYALALVVDGAGHLEQVTVHPDHGRQGIGRVLIDAVAAWARDCGYTTLTLMTFRDVPWNGPYYRRLGFEDVPEAELGPGLLQLRANEVAHGLDISIRGAMRRRLDVTPGEGTGGGSDAR